MVVLYRWNGNVFILYNVINNRSIFFLPSFFLSFFLPLRRKMLWSQFFSLYIYSVICATGNISYSPALSCFNPESEDEGALRKSYPGRQVFNLSSFCYEAPILKLTTGKPPLSSSPDKLKNVAKILEESGGLRDIVNSIWNRPI